MKSPSVATHLSAVADVIFSSVDKITKADEIPVPLCNYKDVYYNRRIHADLAFAQGTATLAEIKKFRLQVGDVIITKDSESPEDIAVPAFVDEVVPNLLCGYHLAIIRPKKDQIDGRYLTQLLQLQAIRNYFFTLSNGVTRFGLGIETIRQATLKFPPIVEQRKIADILTTWDEALEKLDALISVKERRKQALIQQLLTGKKRFNGFAKQPWKKVRMNQILERVFRPIAWSAEMSLSLISIRRRCGGLFRRPDLLGSEYKTQDLHDLKAGDFLVSKRQVVHGAWAIVTPEFEGGHVSKEYAIFTNTAPEKLHMPFFAWLAQTRRMIHLARVASTGVHIEKLIFDPTVFFRETILLPSSLEEQQKIAAILDAADQELTLLRKQRDALDHQKRGLMQRLLTGKIRINIQTI